MSDTITDKITPELRKTIPWQFVAVFLIFSAAIVLAGSLYYRSQKIRIFTEQENNLSVIASMKINQIESWRKERMGDAAVISLDRPIIKSFASLLHSNSREAETDLYAWMKSVRNEYDYKNVMIADTSFKVRLSVLASDTLLSDSIRKEMKTNLKSHTPLMTDLHVSREIPYIHLDIIITLFDSVNKKQKPIGVAILRIDPDKILFPLIQSWPTQSKSSETLLLRREGDSVLYLNELRHAKNTALKLKLPLSNKNLLATKVVNGFLGLTEGIDYRNIPVIGSVQKIPDTPWFMVAKVDKEEIELPLKRDAIIITTVVILLILINALIFGFWIWQQRIKFYKNQLKSNISIHELEERFTTAFRMSPVSVTISSVVNNKFIDVNNTFLRDMEYAREEVIGRTAKELNIWADEGEREWIINEISEKGKIIGKVFSYKTRTGKTLYGLSSMSVVNVNGEPCNLSTVVNITERRKSEEKLVESEELFRKLFENMLNGFAYCKMICEDGKPLDFMYLNVNEAFSTLTGLKDVMGKRVSEAIPGIQEADPELLERYGRVASTGVPEVFEIYVESLKMWFSISVYSPQKGYFVAVFDVITARKLAEEKLQETNEYLSNLFNYANAPIIVWDTSLLITRFNHAFENLSGYSADEVIGKKIDILFPKEEIKSSLTLIEEAISGERWETVEIEIQRKDGESRIVLWNSANIHDKDGKSVIATIAQGHDITVRKRTENSLKENEILLQRIIDNSNSLIYIVDTEGKFIHVNQPLLKLLSTTRSKLIGQTRDVFLPKEVSDIHRKNDLVVIKTGKTQVFEEENFEPDGIHFYLTTKFPLFNNQNEIYGVGGLSTDITERKLAENAIRENEKRLHEAQKMAHLGFWLWDIKTGGVEWSEEVYKIFCLNPETFTPKIDSILELSPWPEDHQRDTELIRKAIESHTPGDYEQKFLRPDKSVGYYYSTFRGNYDDSGELISIVGTVLDITERKNAELALSESEERFRSLYENVTIGIYRTTLDGRIMMANPAMVSMLGFDTFEQLAQRNLQEEGYEPDYPRSKFLESIERDGRIIGLESAWKRRRGKALIVRESANAVRDSNGRILYFDGTVEDITERKKIEEALRESEDKFKYIFDHSLIPKSITLPSGEINVNKAFCEMLGYEPEELKKINWADISHPDDIELTNDSLNLILSGKKDSVRFTKRYIHKNGSVIWVDIGTSLRRDADNNPQYFITSVNDITERKAAEEALRDSEERFSKSFRTSPISFMIANMEDGRIIEINDAFTGISGFTREEAIGNTTLNMKIWVHEEDRKDMIDSLQKGKAILHKETMLRAKEGKIAIVLLSAQIIKLANKNCIISSIEDITERKNAESQIKKLNEELENRVIQRTELLEAANKELEAFSYSVSHDLRAPLRSVHGFTKILIEDYESKLDDEGKRICEIISSSATQMGELIDDLLSFSRIGRSTLNPSVIDMKKMVRVIFEGMSSPAEKKRINLIIGKMPNAFGDVALFGQVWTNLISNAIKYTSKNDVSEIITGSKTDKNMITYFIKDNGVGFEMQYAHKLFGVFQRLHSESDFEGNGVGLAIVQRIIHKHGGKVWAEGESGKGATFYFSLPIEDKRQKLKGKR